MKRGVPRPPASPVARPADSSAFLADAPAEVHREPGGSGPGLEVSVIDVQALEQLAGHLRAARAVTAMTGAGISAESGVPTFRGADGLWRTYSATDLATPEAFARDPGLVWRWYRWRQGIIGRAQPNLGHRALARLQSRIPVFTLITQNVDGLHQRAGSTNVIELHGNIWRARCSRGCGHAVNGAGLERMPLSPAEDDDAPVCPCGALLRPDVVWFGEALDESRIDLAVRAAQHCDVFLAVGTSALVYPAAGLPLIAGRAGALVVEVNVDDTALTPHAGLVVRGPAAEALPALESRV